MSTPPPLTAEQCGRDLGLDAPTLERLATYLRVLGKWQPAINLVGPKSLDDPWRRHILDSAQLAADIPPGAVIADLGSGAGLPGLILAIVTGADTHLIESDRRKAAFLREAARVCEAPCTVHDTRAEALDPIGADVVTARALAPLPRLLPWVHRHLGKTGQAVLLKGANADEELTLAGKNWKMNIERRGSRSDASGTILKFSELAPLDVR